MRRWDPEDVVMLVMALGVFCGPFVTFLVMALMESAK